MRSRADSLARKWYAFRLVRRVGDLPEEPIHQRPVGAVWVSSRSATSTRKSLRRHPTRCHQTACAVSIASTQHPDRSRAASASESHRYPERWTTGDNPVRRIVHAQTVDETSTVDKPEASPDETRTCLRRPRTLIAAKATAGQSDRPDDVIGASGPAELRRGPTREHSAARRDHRAVVATGRSACRTPAGLEPTTMSPTRGRPG